MKFRSFNFGGGDLGYEYECGIQAMLIRGVDALKDWQDFDWNYTEYKGLIGICFSNSPDAEKLDEILGKGLQSTGAQHQKVIHNLWYIYAHGYDEWLRFGVESGDTIVEFDRDSVLADAKEADPLRVEMMVMYSNKSPQDILSVTDPSQYPAAFAEVARRLKGED